MVPAMPPPLQRTVSRASTLTGVASVSMPAATASESGRNMPRMIQSPDAFAAFDHALAHSRPRTPDQIGLISALSSYPAEACEFCKSVAECGTPALVAEWVIHRTAGGKTRVSP